MKAAVQTRPSTSSLSGSISTLLHLIQMMKDLLGPDGTQRDGGLGHPSIPPDAAALRPAFAPSSSQVPSGPEGSPTAKSLRFRGFSHFCFHFWFSAVGKEAR